MSEHRQAAIAAVAASQKKLLEAGSELLKANKIAKHLPEYKEIEQLVTRQANLVRALSKLDL